MFHKIINQSFIHNHNSPPDLFGSLAVEIHRPRGGVGRRRVQNADAVFLAHAEREGSTLLRPSTPFGIALVLPEDVEVKVVGRLREDEGDELLAVLVDVGRNPAPVAVANVVEVLEAALPRQPVRLEEIVIL